MSIGTLAENSLHAALKQWYAQPQDQLEVPFNGFVIDILRGQQLIEIQTGSFSSIKSKLQRLLDQHLIRLVHPVAQERWILRPDGDRARRKSPKHGRIEQVFAQLVYIPTLVTHPNFSLEVVLTREEEIQRDDGKGSWRRRRWSIADRVLIEVVEQKLFASPADYAACLPAALPQPFTNQDLAEALRLRPALAQKMTYTLRQMGLLQVVGKQGRSLLYTQETPKQSL